MRHPCAANLGLTDVSFEDCRRMIRELLSGIDVDMECHPEADDDTMQGIGKDLIIVAR